MGPWTTPEAAPATTLEVKLAANLIISAVFDDFVPEENRTAPAALTDFLGKVQQ